MPTRLAHQVPELNVKDLWYVWVGESDTHYFCVVYGKNGQASSAMHAVEKKDYHKEGEAHDSADEFI